MQDSGYALLDIPGWIFFVRIAQVVVAIIALGLAAYAASVYSPYTAVLSMAPEGLTIFTAVATWIILVYIRVTLRVTSANKYYNYWADVACQVFLLIFWLVSMAVCANWAATTAFFEEPIYDPYGYRLAKRTTYDQLVAAQHSVAAAAGMGGIEMILFAITLAITGMAVNRHLKSNTDATEPAQPPVSMQSVPQEGTAGAYVPPPQPEAHAYQAPPGPTYQADPGQAYPPQGAAPAAQQTTYPHESNPSY